MGFYDHLSLLYIPSLFKHSGTYNQNKLHTTMTISEDSSAPLVVVVGATGTQGGSVINNLEESDKLYRVRGLTRDVSKPAAQALVKRRVEMVACNINVGNEKEVEKAFEHATYIFVRTKLVQIILRSLMLYI
jgi:hypothetical protein